MSTQLPNLSGFEEEAVTVSPVRENEDEVFLIRVPKGYDIEKLNGIGEYSPPGTVQIEAKEGKRGLVSIVELGAFGGENMDVNLLVNSRDGKVIAGPCIKQSLCVSRSVHLNPSTPAKSVDFGAPGPVLMPSGLKPRFTPFGADCPVPTERKKHKKHKKKKKERMDVADTFLNDSYTSVRSSDNDNLVNSLLSEKRTSTLQSDINDNIFMRLKEDVSETPSSTNCSRSHKKKKKKRKSDPDDFVECNSHGLSSLLNSIEPSGEEVKSFVSVKHKRKRKSDAVSHLSDVLHSTLISSSSLEVSADGSLSNSPHKKKKKKKSEADDHVFHDASTNFSSSECRDGDSNQLNNTRVNDKDKKRGHKRKHSSGYQSLEISYVLDESVSMEQISAERKVKKKKRTG